MKTPPFQKGGASFPSKESGVFFNFNVPVHAKVALEIIALLFHVGYLTFFFRDFTIKCGHGVCQALRR